MPLNYPPLGYTGEVETFSNTSETKEGIVRAATLAEVISGTRKDLYVSPYTLENKPGNYPITPYVVGPVGQAGYQTIQSAINAANAAGGGVVYIQPKATPYVENLTFYDAVDLYATPAVSQNQGSTVTISGTHTPPLTGHVGFNSICFISTTNAFNSSAAGSCHLVFLNCESAVQNGYFLNLPNWTGILEFFDINPSTAGAPFAVNDGGINNTGGATLFMFGAALGSGTNVMNLSGTVVVGQGSFNCPVNFQTGSNISMQNVQIFGNTTFSGNATGVLDTCNFYGGSAAGITHSSSGAIRVTASTVQSTNNPAISGAGAGTLTLGDITFIGNSSIAGTLTVSYAGSRIGDTNVNGNLTLNQAGNKIASTSVASTTTAGANSFGSVALVGGTATVNTTAVTASSYVITSVQQLGTVASAKAIAVTAKSAGTSFTLTSADATDTSTVAWFIIN